MCVQKGNAQLRTKSYMWHPKEIKPNLIHLPKKKKHKKKTHTQKQQQINKTIVSFNFNLKLDIFKSILYFFMCLKACAQIKASKAMLWLIPILKQLKYYLCDKYETTGALSRISIFVSGE